MNLLKWLKNKAGKMPITITQAAGLTAVVGAAGFAAMNYLSTPSDSNNTFMPPAINQGEVVYVSQSGGGGQYEANGEVGSSFNAAPSRSIQLANEQAVRQAQTRALEESSQQTPSYGAEGGQGQMGDTPQAYQLSGADLGLGLGGGQNKQLNTSLDTFSTIQNQLTGVTEAVNQAQARGGQQGAPQGDSQGAAKPGETAAGQSAAQLASAQRNWGNGLTRAGGGSGSANSFAIQDSGKNARNRGESEAMAQAGDAIAQARAAMTNLQVEGSRMRAQANFGSSEGFRNDRDAGTHGARRFGKGKDELDFIRKKSAAIAVNKTNAANEGGSPFLASTKISGGLTVSGDNVTTGQGSSSGDLRSTADRQLGGIKGGLDGIATDLDNRSKDRHDLRKWMWIALPLSMVMMPIIGTLAIAARRLIKSVYPPTAALGWWLYGIAAALALGTLYTIYKLIAAGVNYATTYGGDGFSSFAMGLGGLLGVGIAASLLSDKFGIFLAKLPLFVWGAAAAVGFGGAGVFSWLSHNGEGADSADFDDTADQTDIDENADALKTGDEGAKK